MPDTSRPAANIRRVTSPTSPDFEAACTSLPRSFGGDHISHAINGDDRDLEATRLRAAITTAVLDLECYVAGEGVQAVMLVKPPGIAHGVSPHSKGPHAQVVDAMIKDDALRDAAKKLFSIFHEVEERAFGPRCVTDMYYISHLGVEESARGKGLARALIAHVVDRARAEGLPVCLLTMTEKNEALYRHLGFTSHAYLEDDIRGIHTRWWAMKTDLPVPVVKA
ncbi:hypothetical protein CcaverHIS002_0508230 [Cutaneotrichosporon cavernicola]|uniref:N-acetyltransferase domain-containing protein n=1 Tax=Cutaneotrichosporon cavernicola TaxID=279322 RepID=A0AA48L7D9_9TREE|nr:uncharacterized protein CcaverHIS019_0508810 [Cutaneotrichosporon cavernicola]BEI85422.1 hypothetical protein CcaverHIS002_0508230 [Cutaneotrichosporon cavernicola]BEI93253.1 hypothetical protein CcaverHIS019_0508810 [Cutaneotrichosporon cavernicola]BEJ01030.1 hypothetical protein CcaverHIS631_0508870 [Cutaneotrichosporon cavernicola]BEJ08797.1 hypothetical protein CcaverHIS641_0508910 [Cutaneotrichosporon cavernicola]